MLDALRPRERQQPRGQAIHLLGLAKALQPTGPHRASTATNPIGPYTHSSCDPSLFTEPRDHAEAAQ